MNVFGGDVDGEALMIREIGELSSIGDSVMASGGIVGNGAFGGGINGRAMSGLCSTVVVTAAPELIVAISYPISPAQP